MGLGYPHRMYIGPSLATGLNTTRFEAQHAGHISRREGQVIKQRQSTFLYLRDRGESSCYTFHVTNQKTHLLISRSDLLLPHPLGDIRDGRDCPIGIHSLHSSSQLSSAPLQPTNTKRSTSNWTQGTTCLNQYKSLCLVCYPSDSLYTNTLIDIAGVNTSNTNQRHKPDDLRTVWILSWTQIAQHGCCMYHVCLQSWFLAKSRHSRKT